MYHAPPRAVLYEGLRSPPGQGYGPRKPAVAGGSSITRRGGPRKHLRSNSKQHGNHARHSGGQHNEQTHPHTHKTHAVADTRREVVASRSEVFSLPCPQHLLLLARRFGGLHAPGVLCLRRRALRHSGLARGSCGTVCKKGAGLHALPSLLNSRLSKDSLKTYGWRQIEFNCGDCLPHGPIGPKRAEVSRACGQGGPRGGRLRGCACDSAGARLA